MRKRPLLLALLLAAALTSCSDDESSVEQSRGDARTACELANAAGIGDPEVPKEVRKSDLTKAQSNAHSVARRNPTWRPLADSVDATVAAGNRVGFDSTFAVPNAAAPSLNAKCIDAGIRP